MQTLDVINSVTELSDTRVTGKTAVIIDVLRATSVMVTALSYGAKKVIPVLSKEEAFSYRNNHPEELVILAGERNADPIEGFDMGNSPVELIPGKIDGATLVMTTTNGTRTIRKADTASELYVASFLNAKATADVLGSTKELVLIASGTDGLYSVEDVLCAGYLISLLKQMNQNFHLSDAAIAALNLYESNMAHFPGITTEGRHYNILKKKGKNADLQFCFLKDKFPVVCQQKEGAIVKI